MRLHTIQPAIGSTKESKRLGRGIGSGLGKTSGKGHKGQWARSGGGVRPGFEGGQMPLTRKLPKHGFNNHFRKVYATVNVGDLTGFEPGTTVNYEILLGCGLVKRIKDAAGLKVLGNGEITTALTVEASKFSESAKAAIEKAGGTAKVL